MPELILDISNGHDGLNLIFLFGTIIFLGTFGSRLIQMVSVPREVGCVIIGVLLGGDILNIITRDSVHAMQPFTLFALGIIGFMIGGELRRSVFTKYGKRFFTILFTQALGTFFLVAIASSVVAWIITRQVAMSVAMGLVLGAIASTTAPAATTNVLWENKTKGPLTAAILAIVALDDALALLLFKGAATGAHILMGTGKHDLLNDMITVIIEVGGAILLGFLAGYLLFLLLKYIKTNENIFGFSIALLLLVVGSSIALKIDPIMPPMIFGVTIVNLAPRQSKIVFESLKKFSPPVYTLFFVLAGAHIKFSSMSVPIVAMTATYILFRAIGKMSGSSLGAQFAGSPAVVKKYLGLCLLPQGGVAIGLAIFSGQFFADVNPF